jgi:hypothetical protein
MPSPTKPHVSNALAHLRHGVTVCALVVAAAATVQMLVFGCVHFTQVRYQEVRHDAGQQPFTVISTPRHVSGAKQTGGVAPTVGPTTEPTKPEGDVAASLGLPRSLSDADSSLHVVSDMAAMAGTMATVILAMLTILGVAVAGGACVPGVDRVVSSASYALLLAMACVPWHDVFASLPFPGVFGGYGAMTDMSDAVDHGGRSLSLFVLYLVMPLSAMGAAFMVLGRFRAGIGEGIIVTAPSDVDDRLEREMAGIRARGVAAIAPRSVAALNQAIGDKPEDPEPEPPPAEVSARIPGLPPPRTGRNWLGRERRIGEVDPGEALKRPL